MIRRAALVAALLCASATQAEIIDVSFSGRGRVDYRELGDGSVSDYIPPPVGTRVTIRGTIHVGDPGSVYALPDGFTGDVELFDDFGYVIRPYEWDVNGGGSYGSSDLGCCYSTGTASLTNGRLTGFDLYTDYMSDDARITNGGWSSSIYDFSEDGSGTIFWGGSWTLAGAVPEPSAWAMLIVGFGAIGAAMRRRAAGLTQMATIAAIR